MASKTETEIEELRQLILALDLKQEKRIDSLANTLEKKIDSLATKVEVGFTEVKGEIKRLD
ncbi:hypothetical protein VB714_20590, partial [Spirulina sp. 06S082]